MDGSKSSFISTHLDVSLSSLSVLCKFFGCLIALVFLRNSLSPNYEFSRQQLEKLYNKKKAYGAYTDKKKADIAAMVRDEVQKDIEKIVDTDYKLQMLYMTKKPRRMEVFDEDTLKDLAALQDPSIRGGTSAGISTRSRYFT